MTRVTIPQDGWDSKACQHIDLGLLQEIIPAAMIEELLETYQMWEAHERKLDMVALMYWLMALHLYLHLLQRTVYARLVSRLRTVRDDVPRSILSKSAFSYRREQLGSDLLEELFRRIAGPHATAETKGAFWRGMRLIALDGTVESVPDTASKRETFRYRTDDPDSHSPFPQARLVPLSLVTSIRRASIGASLLQEIGHQRLPKQRVRIQARVVKRMRSRYERKKPEHRHVPPFETRSGISPDHYVSRLSPDRRAALFDPY
jgi:hypothetical protein